MCTSLVRMHVHTLGTKQLICTNFVSLFCYVQIQYFVYRHLGETSCPFEIIKLVSTQLELNIGIYKQLVPFFKTITCIGILLQRVLWVLRGYY